MPDLENLLREELQHEAQKVQPELLRPLQVPPDGPVGVRACSRSRPRLR